MTDRERIVEVMAEAPWWTSGDDDMAVVAKHAAEDMLAALEAAGYAIYRPDDCDQLIALPPGWTGSNPFVSKPGTYRLVPVGGEG